MHDEDRAEARDLVVGVVGGGASGTLAAIALLRASESGRFPVRIVLIDRYGRHGLGAAYSTTHPLHLLNAPADQMSAIAGDPKHLIRWAEAAGVDASGFLPRRDYGRYLRETLADEVAEAAPLASLTRVTGSVSRISPGPALVFEDGRSPRVDVIVLATGSLAPEFPFPVPDSPRVIADPWAPGALDQVGDGSTVVVAGTGLTAIDLALTVTGAHPSAQVRLVSRHGLLPRPHLPAGARDGGVLLPAFPDLSSGTVRLGTLLSFVRRAVEANGDNWQPVMDALRPSVPDLWRALPPGDQRVFLRRLSRLWEVHRHRVPEVTGRRIASLRASGRLVVEAGRITGVCSRDDGLIVGIGAGPAARDVPAGWLLNGTGQGTDAASTSDPLLRYLFDAGLARPDPHGLGVDASPDGAVLDRSGAASEVLFTLGPPLRGLWYETTSVPEIRAQAVALSDLIASQV